MSFSCSDDEVVYILISINIRLDKDMSSGHTYVGVLDYNTGTLWRCDDEKKSELRGYPDNVYDKLSH